MYDHRRRVIIESIVLGLTLVLFGVNIGLIILLWRAPIHESFHRWKNTLPIKKGTVPLYSLTPIITLLLASVNLTLYRLGKITLLYPVIMTSIQLVLWSVTLAFWGNCNFWGDAAVDFCYTVYLDSLRFHLWEGAPLGLMVTSTLLTAFLLKAYTAYLCISVIEYRRAGRKVIPNVELTKWV